jgi:hypothetical protein
MLVAWLIGDHLLLKTGSYEVIFMNLCVVQTVAMVMLLRDFGTYGTIPNGCTITHTWPALYVHYKFFYTERHSYCNAEVITALIQIIFEIVIN